MSKNKRTPNSSELMHIHFFVESILGKGDGSYKEQGLDELRELILLIKDKFPARVIQQVKTKFKMIGFKNPMDIINGIPGEPLLQTDDMATMEYIRTLFNNDETKTTMVKGTFHEEKDLN